MTRYVCSVAVACDALGAGTATLRPSDYPKGALALLGFAERVPGTHTAITQWAVKNGNSVAYSGPLLSQGWTEHDARFAGVVRDVSPLVISCTNGPALGTVYILLSFGG